MKLRLLFFPFTDCQSLAATILGGNTRSDSEAAGKRWVRGNFLTANARPWEWVLQCDVRVGAGVFLIIHFTKPAFKYPGGSWNRSLLLCRDSSFASIVMLSQTQKLDKCLKVQRAWTYCIYTSSLTSHYGLHIRPCVFLHQSFTPVLACFVSQIVTFAHLPKFCTPPSSSPLVSSATLFLSPPFFTPSRKTCDGSLRCSESGSKIKDTKEVIGLDTCCKSQRARVLIMGLYFYPFFNYLTHHLKGHACGRTHKRKNVHSRLSGNLNGLVPCGARRSWGCLIELWIKYGKKCQVALELFKINVTQMGKNLITDVFPAQLLMCHIGFDKGEETLDLVRLEMTNSEWKMKFIQMNCAPVVCLLRLLRLFCALFKWCIYYHEEWDTRKWVHVC